MANAVLRIIPLFQLLEARVIFCAVIGRWPVCKSSIGIVCVMVCDPGSRNMIAHPAYRLSKNRRVRGRFPVCLRFAQVRESAMRIDSFYIVGNGAAQSVDLKNQPGTLKTSSKIPGSAGLISWISL